MNAGRQQGSPPAGGSPQPAPAAISTTAKFDLLEALPRAVGVVSGATVALSVAYNWSYFETFDPPAIQLLSISDHVTSALQWLPGTIALYLISWLSTTISNYILPMQFPLPPRPSRREMTKWKKYLTILCIMSLIAGTSLFHAPVDRTVFYTVLSGTWLVFLWKEGSYLGWSNNWVVAMLMIPGTLVFALSAGNQRAMDDFALIQGDSKVTIGNDQSVENVLLLRRLDKGLLIRKVSENEVIFLPWDQIKQFSTTKPKIDRRWQICISFNVLCK